MHHHLLRRIIGLSREMVTGIVPLCENQDVTGIDQLRLQFGEEGFQLRVNVL